MKPAVAIHVSVLELHAMALLQLLLMSRSIDRERRASRGMQSGPIGRSRASYAWSQQQQILVCISGAFRGLVV